MHRIVGREGGFPSFYEIRKRIIDEYGLRVPTLKVFLEASCHEYRLQYKEVDETGARQPSMKGDLLLLDFLCMMSSGQSSQHFMNVHLGESLREVMLQVSCIIVVKPCICPA